jgi:polar amino acid transport system ATP-binding protein/sulfate transport system ATP-binding protein
VVGFLGPSGVGKSTLFRILAGLETPKFGRVLLEASKEPVTPGQMGVVFQSYPLLKYYTVLDNLVVAGRCSGMMKQAAETHAMALLKEFELEDKADSYPKQLSGGQRQRVAIAQQLMCSGHFLLMDEPFSGLDPIMKDKACETIKKVAAKDEKNTIIVVTHDISAALAVSDTLWLLGRERDADGKIIPGAYIKKTYDLIGLGLAWHQNVTLTPEFGRVLAEIREDFRTL